MPRSVERDTGGFGDPVPGFQEPGLQRGQVDIHQRAVAFDHAAGDEHGVDQSGMSGTPGVASVNSYVTMKTLSPASTSPI